MLPLDDMAQSVMGERFGGSPIRGCDYHPNVALAIRVGPKGCNSWPQAGAGDYKVAQPPYLAGLHQKYFQNYLNPGDFDSILFSYDTDSRSESNYKAIKLYKVPKF